MSTTHQTEAKRLVDRVERLRCNKSELTKAECEMLSEVEDELSRLDAVEVERDQLRTKVEQAFTMLQAGMPEFDASDVLDVLRNGAKVERLQIGEPVAWLDEMLADTRETFDANASETPQAILDVIEYVKSWITVYRDKSTAQPAAPAHQIEDHKKDCATCTHQNLPAFAPTCQKCNRMANGARANWALKPAAPALVPLTDSRIMSLAEDLGVIGPRSRVGNLHTCIGPFARAVELAHGIGLPASWKTDHDYPACALFRGGQCTCDAEGEQKPDHIPDAGKMIDPTEWPDFPPKLYEAIDQRNNVEVMTQVWRWAKPIMDAAVQQYQANTKRYRLLRSGQHFSVINGIGDTMRGEALDAAVDAIASARGVR